MTINAFNKFQALLPQSPRSVITITAVNANGTSTGTTSAGVTVNVVGDSVSVGQKAFIQNGQIVRQAPNITVVTVNV